VSKWHAAFLYRQKSHGRLFRLLYALARSIWLSDWWNPCVCTDPMNSIPDEETLMSPKFDESVGTGWLYSVSYVSKCWGSIWWG